MVITPKKWNQQKWKQQQNQWQTKLKM